jgi:hypothetical protein
MANDPFTAIELDALHEVTGGRITKADSIDPALIQGIAELAKAVQAMGQGMVAAKQQGDGQWMQMIQQMAQSGMFGRRR